MELPYHGHSFLHSTYALLWLLRPIGAGYIGFINNGETRMENQVIAQPVTIPLTPAPVDIEDRQIGEELKEIPVEIPLSPYGE